jgi:diguanylate cyclase (GGDEF)-like protein
LDGYNHAKALQIAEKICEDVRVRHFYIFEYVSIQITASIGIATYPDVKKENLLEYADNALYRAKKQEETGSFRQKGKSSYENQIDYSKNNHLNVSGFIDVYNCN